MHVVHYIGIFQVFRKIRSLQSMHSAINFWVKWVTWRVVIHGFHAIFSVVSWRRGRKLPPIQNALIFKSAKCLAREIRERKVKSEEVVQAYRDRMLEVEPYLNAVVEDRFQAALEEAREVDLLIQSGRYTEQELAENKPFLGVPFTVKDFITVKGMKNTAGFKLFKDRVADRDSVVVGLMRQAGGIVLALSNSAEFGMMYETTNLLHGTTCNPYDTTRTPGGSSGGESALLGAGASLIGLGNDLAGSLRVPAHFTGIFAHKGSKGLVPSLDCLPIIPSHLTGLVQAGPMCRYPEDLGPMMKVLTSGRLDFDSEVDFKKLKILYSEGIRDPFVAALDPDISLAIKKAISHFTTSYGVTAKEFKVPNLDQSIPMICHLLRDAEINYTKTITLGKVERLNVVFEVIKSLFRRSDFSLAVLLLLAAERYGVLINRKDIPHYRTLLNSLDEDFGKLLDENTVFLFPTFPRTAPYHSEISFSLLGSACHTAVFNFIGLPATAVPLGLGRKGMPHGMQVIGAKNNDPLTIACATELGRVFGGWIPPR